MRLLMYACGLPRLFHCVGARTVCFKSPACEQGTMHYLGPNVKTVLGVVLLNVPEPVHVICVTMVQLIMR